MTSRPFHSFSLFPESKLPTPLLTVVMRFTFLLTTLFLATSLRSATLTIDVRDGNNRPVQDAVVYAIPQGKKLPLAKRSGIMDQKNRMFVPHVLPVQTGTLVSFPNSDDIHHQVYSFSPAKTFQLPLYKGTPGKPVLFDRPGVVELGCNIHDRMNAYIIVVDTPYFALSGKEGRIELASMDEGHYLLHVWNAESKKEPAPLSINLSADDRKALRMTVGKR